MRPCLLAIACVLVGGCYHDAEPAPAPPLAHKAAAGPSYETTIADPLGFLPIDSEVVFGLDAQQLRSSPSWRKFESAILGAAGPTLETFKTACNIDPIARVQRVRGGARDITDANPQGVLVIEGLDRARLMGCVEASLARHPERGRIDDGVVLLQGNSTAQAVRFVGPTTLVMYFGRDASKARVATILADGAPLRSSSTFVELFDRIDSQEAMWFVLNGNAAVFKKAGLLGVHPSALLGWASLANGLALSVRMRVESPSAAGTLVALGQSQAIPVAQSYVEDIQLTAEDADVVLAVTMTQDQLDRLMSLVGGVGFGP